MPELIPVLDRAAIDQRIADVARQISIDYKDADLVMIGILKGAFVFLADLIRQVELARFAIDFIRVASYDDGMESSGNIRMIKDVEVDITNKDLLLVEDILDSGFTLNYLVSYLKQRNPKSVKICTLIDKRERRQIDIPADYVCHMVEKGFLVGYGMDYAEAYRNLPEVFELK